LEVWNNLSEFKIRIHRNWQIAFYALLPQFMALEPPAQIRAIWDDLLDQGRHVVALGGVDAHTLQRNIGPVKVTAFPYSYHFRTIRNHILLESKLSGDLQQDEHEIMQALRLGHTFICNDRVHSGNGFRFILTDAQSQFNMGDTVAFRKGQRLVADLPAPAECRLLCNGKNIDQSRISGEHFWEISHPGIYRLECYRYQLGKNRGWIFSNPITVTP
jgi:hypothetical protein